MQGLSGAESLVSPLYAELLDPSHYQFDSVSLWHFGAALVAAVCAGLVVYWERGSRVSRLFAGFALLFTVWAAGRGVLRLLNDTDLIVFLSRRLYVLIMLAMPFLYQFIQIMLRTDARRAALIRINWLIGIAIGVASFNTPYAIESWYSYRWGYEPSFGPLGYLSIGWVALMMAAAAVDGIEAWRRTPGGSVERDRVALLGAAIASLYLAFVDFLPSMGVAVYPFAFVPITGFVLLTAWLTLRYGLIEVTPQLAAQQIAEMVRGALLIVDRYGIVQFANAQAEVLIGRHKLAGQSGTALMGDALDPVSLGL